MTDLDKRLASTLKGMGDAHIESIGEELPRLRSEVVRRTRRRKLGWSAAMGLAATAAVVAIVMAWPGEAIKRADDIGPATPVGHSITEYIPLGNIHGLADHVASMDAGIYVAGNDYLHRIDPATGEVRSTDGSDGTLYESTGSERCCIDLAGSGDILWRVVTYGDGQPTAAIQRADPATGESPPEWSQAGAASAGGGGSSVGLEKFIAVADDFAWSIDPAEPLVRMMDPRTVETIDAYEFAGTPRLLSAAEGGVYVAGEFADSVADPPDPEFAQDGIAWYEVGGRRVSTQVQWDPGCLEDIAADHRGIFAIDNCSSELVWVRPQAQGAIAYSALPAQGSVLTTGLGSVWVTHESSSSVSRFVPTTAESGEQSLELVEEIELQEPGVDIVAGGGAIWVAHGEASSVTRITIEFNTPTPTEEPTPEEEAARCSSVRFVSTAEGFETEPRKSEESGFAPPYPSFYMGSWFTTDGQPPQYGRIDLQNNVPLFSQGQPEEIEMLGGTGILGHIESGFSVEFSYQGCDYILHSYGPTREETRRFAEELTVADQGDLGPFDTIWPQHTRDEAIQGCASPEPWQTDPVQVVHQFVFEELGWSGTTATEYGFQPGDRVVRHDVVDPDIPDSLVRVSAFEFRPDCWLVSHVEIPTPDESRLVPFGVGVSVRGRDVEATWARQGAAGFVVSIEYQGDNGVLADTVDTAIQLRLPAEPTTTGYILVLYKDDQNRTIGAHSATLPAGDFGGSVFP